MHSHTKVVGQRVHAVWEVALTRRMQSMKGFMQDSPLNAPKHRGTQLPEQRGGMNGPRGGGEIGGGRERKRWRREEGAKHRKASAMPGRADLKDD